MTKKQRNKKLGPNSVLLINQHNLPLNIMTLSRALHMWAGGKAQFIETYPDRYFKIWGDQFLVPQVMRMNYFVKITKKRQLKDYYNRLNVWKRDKGTCQYCGHKVNSQNFTVDHVVPRSKGGGTNWKNIVTCCWPCNSKKDSYTLEQCGMKLLSIPLPPEMDESVESTILERFKKIKNVPHESWRKYI